MSTTRTPAPSELAAGTTVALVEFGAPYVIGTVIQYIDRTDEVEVVQTEEDGGGIDYWPRTSVHRISA